MKKRHYHAGLTAAPLLFCLLLFAGALEVTAQSNLGRDFYVSFPPNFRAASATDSVYIVIVASERSAGRIDYRNRRWESFTENWGIVDPSRPYVLALPAADFELRGVNTARIFAVQGDTASHDVERPAPASIRIRVSAGRQAVTVFALSRAAGSSGATSVLPVSALGTEYMVLAFNGDGRTRNGTSLESRSTPSQCAIVATANDTRVRIELATRRSYFNRDSVLETTLQRGDVYLVQANLGIPDNLRDDLSGTRIIADKAVAVFGGQQSAQVPSVSGRDEASRSNLLAQMPPLETWGKRYFVLPFPGAATPAADDLFRVLAKDDNTVVTLDDGAPQLLNEGEMIELPLTAPVEITSSKSVLVGAYKSSVRGAADDPAGQFSDPAFVIVNPVEQYLEEMTFAPPFPGDEQGPFYAADQVFLSCIVRADRVEQILLDGAAAQGVFSFAPIGSGEYVHGSAAVAAGVHDFNAPGGGMLQATIYGVEDGFAFCAGRGLAGITDAHELDITTELSVVEERVLRGEPHDLAIRLDALDVPARFGSTPSLFDVELVMDAACLIPTEAENQGVIENGMRRLRLRGRYEDQQPGDILIDLPVDVAADGPPCTSVEITDFNWLDAAEQELSTIWEAPIGEICKRGDSLEVRLSVDDARGADTDVRRLRITVENVFVPDDFELSELARIEFSLEIDAGLEPLEAALAGTVVAGRRLIDIDAPYTGEATMEFGLDVRVNAAALAAECTPMAIGRAAWFDADGEQLRATAEREDGEFCLIDNRLALTLGINDMEGAPGESVTARVTLDSFEVSPDFAAEFAARYGAARLEISYNATVLTPAVAALRGVLNEGFRRTTFDLDLSNASAGMQLAELPLLVGLGDAEFSDVTAFVRFTDLDDVAVSVDADSATAVMSLLDVWRDDIQGVRLLNPQRGVLQMTLEPNPASTAVRLTLDAPGELDLAGLRVYDARGVERLRLDAQVQELATQGSLDVDLSQLSSGLYFVRLGVGSDVLVRTLIIR